MRYNRLVSKVIVLLFETSDCCPSIKLYSELFAFYRREYLNGRCGISSHCVQSSSGYCSSIAVLYLVPRPDFLVDDITSSVLGRQELSDHIFHIRPLAVLLIMRSFTAPVFARGNILYRLKYSRIKFFTVWLDNSKKQIFTDKISWSNASPVKCIRTYTSTKFFVVYV